MFEMVRQDIDSLWYNLYLKVLYEVHDYKGNCYQSFLNSDLEKRICSMVGLYSLRDMSLPCRFSVIIREHTSAMFKLLIVDKSNGLPPIVSIPFSKTSYEPLMREYAKNRSPEYWFIKEKKPMSDKPMWYAIDHAIAPIITRLWKLGYKTHWSCAGHPTGTYINLTPPSNEHHLSARHLKEIGWSRVILSEEHCKINETPHAVSLRISNPILGYDSVMSYIIRDLRLKRLIGLLDTYIDGVFVSESLAGEDRVVYKDGKYYGAVPSVMDVLKKK